MVYEASSHKAQREMIYFIYLKKKKQRTKIDKKIMMKLGSLSEIYVKYELNNNGQGTTTRCL